MSKATGSWERRVSKELSEGTLKVSPEVVETDGLLPLYARETLAQKEILLEVLGEIRKMNFLLESISGVEIDVEAFNGRI